MFEQLFYQTLRRQQAALKALGIRPSLQDDGHLQNLAVLARGLEVVFTALPLLTFLRELVEPSFVVVLYTLMYGRATDSSVLSHGFPTVRWHAQCF